MFDAENRPASFRAAAELAVRCTVLIGLLYFPASFRAADVAGSIAGSAFVPHSSTRGKTMFVRLSPEVTGVRTENRYADPRMRGDLYQEFEGGSIGTGVAIGDYDGDGRPDIFAASKTESCRLSPS